MDFSKQKLPANHEAGRGETLAIDLCRAELAPQSVWLVGELPPGQVELPETWTLRVSSLAAGVPSRPRIVVLGALSPSAVRTLEKLSPELVVLVGHAFDASLLEALHRTLGHAWVLGPGAHLRVNPQGRGAQLAVDAALFDAPELAPGARLRIAPTPEWILPGLSQLQDQDITGWLRADTLSPHWRTLLEQERAPWVCAIATKDPGPDAKPWDKGLEAMALAQELSAPLGLDLWPSPELMARLAAPEGTPDTSNSVAWDPESWSMLYGMGTQRRGYDRPVPSPEDPVRKVSPLLAVELDRAHTQYRRWQEFQDIAEELPLPDALNDASRSLEVLQAASEHLTDHESKVVLKGWGFEVTRQAVGKSASAALSYAQKIGYPVALKAISPSLRHKSAVDCVALDVANASSLKRHYQKLNDRAIQEVGEDQLDGVLVSEMAPEGLDIQIRALRGSSGAWVLFARCIQGLPAWGLANQAWGFLPETMAASLRFSDRVVPAKCPERQLAVERLATELIRLLEPIEELGERLFCIELDPLRIWTHEDATSTATVLDAYIEQDAHIHGA